MEPLQEQLEKLSLEVCINDESEEQNIKSNDYESLNSDKFHESMKPIPEFEDLSLKSVEFYVNKIDVDE